MKYFCTLFIILDLCIAAEYPYYVETTDGGYTWSAPTLLPAISSAKFWWTELDCEVINNRPFAVHNDLDGVMQLFYPNPDDPGSPGDWNWIILNVQQVGEGSFAWQDTTWTMTVLEYPNISYAPDSNLILLSYKCNFTIDPPPVGWTDGNYLGGIASSDGGRNWLPCRPMSGPLLPTPGGPVEVAHRLVTIYDTTFVYATWIDAGEGEIGNQYFELGTVQTIWWWDADIPKRVLPADSHLTPRRLEQRMSEHLPRRMVIAEVGGESSILGPAGKNICVAVDGNTIAVLYGEPSDPYDPNQPFGDFHITYSTNRGTTWNHYGPFNTLFSSLRRIYPAVDGCENFTQTAGNLFFAWQEGQIAHNPNHTYVCFDENIPASPSFMSPIQLPNNIFPWMPCIGVNPDDDCNVMVTAWSYLAHGDNANYAWISNDGGYTWSDTITITPPVDTSVVSTGAGHFRWGTGDYAFFTYHDEYDPGVEEHNVSPVSNIHLKVNPTITSRVCNICFITQQKEKINLNLFDVAGRFVKTIYAGYSSGCEQKIILDLSEIESGIYVVLLESSSLKQKTKLIKVR